MQEKQQEVIRPGVLQPGILRSDVLRQDQRSYNLGSFKKGSNVQGSYIHGSYVQGTYTGSEVLRSGVLLLGVLHPEAVNQLSLYNSYKLHNGVFHIFRQCWICASFQRLIMIRPKKLRHVRRM